MISGRFPFLGLGLGLGIVSMVIAHSCKSTSDKKFEEKAVSIATGEGDSKSVVFLTLKGKSILPYTCERTYRSLLVAYSNATTWDRRRKIMHEKCSVRSVKKLYAHEPIPLEELTAELATSHSARLSCLMSGYGHEKERLQTLIQFGSRDLETQTTQTDVLIGLAEEVDRMIADLGERNRVACESTGADNYSTNDRVERDVRSRIVGPLYWEASEVEVVEKSACDQSQDARDRSLGNVLESISTAITKSATREGSAEARGSIRGEVARHRAELEQLARSNRRLGECLNEWKFDGHKSRLEEMLTSKINHVVDPYRKFGRPRGGIQKVSTGSLDFFPITWKRGGANQDCPALVKNAAISLSRRIQTEALSPSQQIACRPSQDHLKSIGASTRSSKSGGAINWKTYLSFRGVWNDFIQYICRETDCQ